MEVNQMLEFQWVFEQFPHVIASRNEGKYLDRVIFRWTEGVFAPPKALALLFQLIQADGWQIEAVRWEWLESHLGMRGCTLVRHLPRTQ